jgi:hypothetical protein
MQDSLAEENAAKESRIPAEQFVEVVQARHTVPQYL